MFAKVEYFITSTITPDKVYVIDSDQVDRINKYTPAMYRHTLSLIEPTKMLRKNHRR